MKTKYWIAILAALFALLCALSVWLLWPQDSAYAEVWSEGVLVQTLPLDIDTTIVVSSSCGSNTVCVEHGSISVTQATCPDHYCMKRGQCSGGADIICLPNQLIIHFAGAQALDATAG